MRGELLVAGKAAGGLGSSVALALLVPMEAGVPIPLPSDRVMLAVGERVAAGALPLWLAVVAFEVIALVGTTALFLACRGPGHAVIGRIGPRLGLNRDRLARASAFLEQRGRSALALGRGTPGLRTVTVVAAGGSGLSARRALPALVLGSSVFLQLHLVLGLLLGPLARQALDRARDPALVAIGLAIAVAVVVWLARRGGRAGSQALAEAACPACLALGVLAERRLGLGPLAGRPLAPAPGSEEPTAED
jgi:membrane protein DedA with SNARE-associated domain